jgi:hypothetical protein
MKRGPYNNNENDENRTVKRLPFFQNFQEDSNKIKVRRLTDDNRPFPPRMLQPSLIKYDEENIKVSSSLGQEKVGIDPSKLYGKDLDFYNTWVNPKHPYLHPSDSPGHKAPVQKQFYSNENIKENRLTLDEDEEYPEDLYFGGKKKRNRQKKTNKTMYKRKTRKSQKSQKSQKSRKSRKSRKTRRKMKK